MTTHGAAQMQTKQTPAEIWQGLLAGQMQTKQSPAETWQGLMAAKEVCRATGVSRAHWYSLVREQRAPAPALRLGTRFTRWKASDVQAWLADPQGWIAAHTETGVPA